jgi:small neutral amino acid transporter SnatA (MarC family)
VNGSVLLAVVAIVAAVNPSRVAETAAGLPEASRPPAGSARGVALIGAGAAGVVYVLLAVVASPLLDAIDVSAPTMMVAAGLVLILAAAKDLFVGAPAPEPALDGWGAALVPVAVPASVRPQVGVAAVAIGATHGPAAVVVGSILTVGGVAIAVTAHASDGARRVVRWFGVVAVAVAVVAGAAFAVDGVYSV